MPINFESVAETAQKYVALCPVLVAGTGLSIPHGLPSMPDLAAELRKRVNPTGDLAAAAAWRLFTLELDKGNDLEKALHDVELTPTLLNLVVRTTWEIVAERDLSLRNAYIADPQSIPIRRLLEHLLRTANETISIVTTNYDRLIEYAASSTGAVVATGFVPGLCGEFISDLSTSRCQQKCPGSQGRVWLWKVHGSLDWFRNTTGESFSLNGVETPPPSLQPLIVTPGVAKYRETHKDPFRTVITMADNTLEHAKAFLCIGYGFNDEHIQPKIFTQLSKHDIPIVVVTRKLSQAGRDSLLKKPFKKFLILEEAEGGTMVYHPGAPTGEVLPKHTLWALPSFLDMLLGEQY